MNGAHLIKTHNPPKQKVILEPKSRKPKGGKKRTRIVHSTTHKVITAPAVQSPSSISVQKGKFHI